MTQQPSSPDLRPPEPTGDAARATGPAVLAAAHLSRGEALKRENRLEEALACYDQALAIQPEHLEAWGHRGLVLQRLGRPEQALASYDRVLALRPDYAQVHMNRGVALQAMRRPDEALASYDQALAWKPDYAMAHCNRGNALRELNRQEEAVASYDRALAIQPDYAEAHINRGPALVELQRIDEAIASYDRALAARPHDANARLYKGMALLLAGRLEEGWPLFEWRWKTAGFPSLPRPFDRPLWLGEQPLEGKTILLHAEQGLGDALQFCRYAPLVGALGARVLLEVKKPLVGIMRGLEGVSRVIERGQTLPGFDFHCPLMSLPLAFKTTLDSIPGARGYLRSSTDRLAIWRQRLGPRQRPRVGLVWSGNPGYQFDARRSLELKQLLAYLPDNCEYISLQKDVRERDMQALAQSRIRHFDTEHEDFSDSAAICDLVDLVVSSDTSGAHLAGALGRPAWVLLPHVPDWRWMLEREGSPWYESVRLYRQAPDWRWAPVLERLARDLSGLRS